MAGFDALMQATVADAPNQAQIANTGLTLGQLRNQSAMSALDLQQRRQMLAAMSDPRYAAILASMMQGGAPDTSRGGIPGPVGGAGMPGGGNGAGAPGADVQGFASDYPTAMMPLLEQQMKVRQSFATINKDNADAAKARQETHAKGVDILGNQAAGLVTQDGPITPMQDAMLVNQALHVGTPREIIGARPSLDNQDGYRQWAGGLASAASGWVARQAAPSSIAKTQADTQVAEANAAYKPQEVAIAQQNADSGAMQAQTSRNTQNIGEVVTDKNTGTAYNMVPLQVGPNQWVRVATPVSQAPNAAGAPAVAGQPDAASPMANTPAERAALAVAQAQDRAGNAVSIAVPAAATAQPTGQSFRPGVGAAAEAQIGQTAKIVGDMQKSIPSAYQGLGYISELRAADRQGIYSGGIQGTDWFKDLANVVGSTPFAPQDMATKIAATQAWDSGTGELLVQMLRQMPGNRFTNQELNFLRGIKPNTLQQPDARAKIYNMLERGFQNQISFAQSAAKYTAQPGVTNLGDWTPPGGATAGSETPQRIRGDDGYSLLPSGALFVGPDGKVRRKP